MLPADRKFTVVTHGLPIAAMLAERPNITLQLVGGQVRQGTLAAVGSWAEPATGACLADVAFAGTNGISTARGLTTPDLAEAAVKRALIASARRTVVLADHSKVGQRRVCPRSRPVRGRHDHHRQRGGCRHGPRDRRRGTGGACAHDAPTHAVAGPVVTVTPNPSLDHTVEVPVLERGEVQRTSHALVEAGGKGVNVARALAKHGHRATAILPAGDDAQRMIGLLNRKGATVAVPIAGAIRTNIAVVEEDGTTTKLNEPGATLSAAEVAALLTAVEDAPRTAAGLAGRGRQPAGRGARRLLRPGGRQSRWPRASRWRSTPPARPWPRPSMPGRPSSSPTSRSSRKSSGSELVTVGDVIDAGRELRATRHARTCWSAWAGTAPC